MNWIKNVVRPKIRGLLAKRELPDNMWIKCPETGQMVFHRDLEANLFVIPGSDYHMRVAAPTRLKMLFDDGEYEKNSGGCHSSAPDTWRHFSSRYTSFPRWHHFHARGSSCRCHKHTGGVEPVCRHLGQCFLNDLLQLLRHCRPHGA